MGPRGRAVVNLLALDDTASFAGAPSTMAYDAEDEAARRARRLRAWTPARILGPASAMIAAAAAGCFDRRDRIARVL